MTRPSKRARRCRAGLDCPVEFAPNMKENVMASRFTVLRTAAITALAVLLPMGALAAAPSATALAKIKCHQTTGVASVDPIVYHNQPQAKAHPHQFFGNSDWLAKGNNANFSDLIGGGTNCRNATDTAGYWTPTLVSTVTGQVIPTRAFTAYYRPWTGVGGPKFGEGIAYPQDVRLIGKRYNWSCGMNSGVRAQPVDSIPDCTGLSGGPGNTLTLHIDFPSCWNGKAPDHHDGEVGNTADDVDWAYPVGSGKKIACPSTHPVKTISLREAIQFKYVGNGSDVALSSDAMAGTSGGRSAHGDFWNTWDQAGLESLVHNCISGKGTFTVAECG